MSDVLVRIKRAVLAGRYAFSEKARIEMETDRLTESDVAESVIDAVAIDKRLRSRSSLRSRRIEYLYVIQSTNFEGELITEGGEERFSFLVSSSAEGLGRTLRGRTLRGQEPAVLPLHAVRREGR